MLKVEIFTDGACRGNPGLGGWGAILRYADHEKELYGSEPCTTNNRMELTATIMALGALKVGCTVHLTTDSQYVKRGITEWLINWKKRGWMTASKQPLKNSDLWKELENKTERHHINWYWIRGHSGHLYNERADRLANRAMDEYLLKGTTGRAT